VVRWARHWWWLVGALTLLGAVAVSGRRYLQRQAVACGARSPTACASVKRLARPLSVVRFPGARAALDQAYSAEFAEAEELYSVCFGADRSRCEGLAWRDLQRFRSDLERRRTAEAARLLCEHRSRSACVALGVYLDTGLGIPANPAARTVALQTAFELGARYPCRWGEVCSPEPFSVEGKKAAEVEQLRQRDKVLGSLHRGSPHTEYFYVNGARLETLNLQRDARRPYSGSEPLPRNPNAILAGTAIVLAVRTYDPGYVEAIDDERFESFSIEIPSFRFGTPVDLQAPHVRAYFSAGSQAWSPRMGAEYAEHAQGTVTILSADRSDEMKVRLNASCQPMRTPEERPLPARFAPADPSPEARSFVGEFTFVRRKPDLRGSPRLE
jgi:hypothetical protein